MRQKQLLLPLMYTTICLVPKHMRKYHPLYSRNSIVVTVYQEVAVEIPESNVKLLMQKQNKLHPSNGLPLLATSYKGSTSGEAGKRVWCLLISPLSVPNRLA
jgi:hypothetical protein